LRNLLNPRYTEIKGKPPGVSYFSIEAGIADYLSKSPVLLGMHPPINLPLVPLLLQ
jgi:hypothetical protein